MGDKCYKCFGFSRCLSAALNNTTIRCIDFGALKKCVDETVDKFNELGLPNPLTQEEMKELIYCVNRR